MEPISTGRRIKTYTRKNYAPHVVYFDYDSYDNETFVNSYSTRRYTKIFAARNVLSERGFIFEIEDGDLGFTYEVEHIITGQKWKKICKHPLP